MTLTRCVCVYLIGAENYKCANWCARYKYRTVSGLASFAFRKVTFGIKMFSFAFILKPAMLPLARHLTKAAIHTSGATNAKVALVCNE